MIPVLLPLVFLALGVRFKNINKAVKSRDRSLLYGELFMLALTCLVILGIYYLMSKAKS